MSFTVTLGQLVANPDNPRETLGNIKDLAGSIRSVGLLQPLLVVEIAQAHDLPRYMVVDGHRRFAAMQSIEYAEPIAVVVTEMDRTERVVAAVAAGAFTRQLTPLERAKAFAALRDDHGLTQTQIAERVGCSQSVVNQSLRLLELSTEAIADLEAGRMSTQQALKMVRTAKRHPQGRKAYVPIAEQHNVDLKLCLTVRPSTHARHLGRDVATWFERELAAGRVPHASHIVAFDDWGVSE